jgi:flagellar basal-body rod protein FlgC
VSGGGPFAGIDIASTGMGFARYWTETIGHNIANINTVSTFDDPFRARLVVAQPIDPSAASGGGVAVGQIIEQEGDPAMLYAPDSPLANDDGYVAAPVVDLAGQMSDMILASRMYQANISVLKDSREALESATNLGRA